MTLTASTLFAMAHGYPQTGAERCYYCGGPCEPKFFHEVYHKELYPMPNSATGPANPKGKFCCKGCVLGLAGKMTVHYPGDLLEDGQSVQKHSWVVTQEEAIACRKPDHLDYLQQVCTEPPETPFVLLLTDGKFHLLYRCPVNLEAGPTVKVMLNGEVIEYEPRKLAERLRTVGRITAAAYGAGDAIHAKLAIETRYRDGTTLLKAWDKVKSDSLTKLAAWLCQDAVKCQVLYPEETAEQQVAKVASEVLS